MSITTRLHDGRIFPSMSAADRALGVPIGTTSAHLDRHGTTASIGRDWPTKGRRVELDGTTYPSITAAAKALGVSRDAINYRRGYRKPWETPASGAK